MGSEHERPDSGDGGTACAHTDHEAANDVEYGNGSPARGKRAA